MMYHLLCLGLKGLNQIPVVEVCKTYVWYTKLFQRGGYFLVKGLWGCAAGWGRIFTTGLTIMGLHF